MACFTVFVLLCPLIMCWTVIGGLETGSHANRPFQNDQVAILIERMNDQEDRLRSLEKARSEQARGIVEKDRKIKNLEQEVYDIKQQMISLYRLISGQKNDKMGNKRSHVSGLKPQLKGRYPSELVRRDGVSSGTQYKSNETDEFQKSINVFENQKLKNKDSSESSKPVGIGRKQFQRKINKRVDSTPPTAVAFSVFLGSNTDVVTQSIIKYDGVMIDKGNGYSHGNGIYVVPVSGVYVFTWSTTSAVNNGQEIFSRLMVNGVDRSGTCADSDASDWDSSTGLIVTSVNAGDHVYITSQTTGQIVSSAAVRSTFSGWLLF